MSARDEWEESVAKAWGRGVLDGFLFGCAVFVLIELARWAL